MGYSTKIGDSQPVAAICPAGALPISEVTLAELQDIDSTVNNALISGKRLGAMYCFEVSTGVMEVVIAAGPDTDDNWVRLTSQGAISALTPTVAGNVADAAGITAQLNLVETAINALIAGSVITPA